MVFRPFCIDVCTEWDLFSIFYMWIAFLKRLSFLQGMLGDFAENQMSIALWTYFSLFCSISLCFCLCASNMVVLLLWFCSITWSQVFWCLQPCSLCSGLLWQVCFHLNVIGYIFLFLWRMTVEFCWWVHWIYRLLLMYSHFHNPNSEHGILSNF
jgi:hypothetical protein